MFFSLVQSWKLRANVFSIVESSSEILVPCLLYEYKDIPKLMTLYTLVGAAKESSLKCNRKIER